MRVLRIEPAQQRQREGVEGADHELKLRDVVKAVGARVQIEDGDDRAEIEFAIEMRKQLVVARALPAQRVAQRIGIDRDQEQAGLAEKMFSRGFRDLRGVEK